MSTKSVSAATLLLIGLHMPSAAGGQTNDQTIHACYIPAVGVVYRIKASGLPSACISKAHIEFEWNVQGVPGNLGLAGHACPAGQFLSGYDATGALICAEPATAAGAPNQ